MKHYRLFSVLLLTLLTGFHAWAANYGASGYRYEWVPATPPAWLLNTAPYNGAWADADNPTPIINERTTWGEIIITDAAYNAGAFGDGDGSLVSFQFVEYGADGVTPFASFDNSAYSIDNALQLAPIAGTLIDGPSGHKIFESLTGAYDDLPYTDSPFPLRRGVWVGLGYLHWGPDGDRTAQTDDPILDPNLVWIGSDPQYYGEWVYRGTVGSNSAVPEAATTFSLLLLSSMVLASMHRRECLKIA